MVGLCAVRRCTPPRRVPRAYALPGTSISSTSSAVPPDRPPSRGGQIYFQHTAESKRPPRSPSTHSPCADLLHPSTGGALPVDSRRSRGRQSRSFLVRGRCSERPHSRWLAQSGAVDIAAPSKPAARWVECSPARSPGSGLLEKCGTVFLDTRVRERTSQRGQER